MHNMPQIMIEIKNNSDNLHKATEMMGFTKRLMDKKANKESYAEYLYNLKFVYESLEYNLSKHKDLPEIVAFYTPELFKTELISKDVEALYEGKEKPELLASTVAFISHLNLSSKRNPKLVIAHAYTRFLADLFGGRLFFDLLKDYYKLSEGELNYYKIDKIDDIKAYVMGYHRKIIGLNLEGDLKDEFINEISKSYIYNIAISNELDVKYFKN